MPLQFSDVFVAYRDRGWGDFESVQLVLPSGHSPEFPDEASYHEDSLTMLPRLVRVLGKFVSPQRPPLRLVGLHSTQFLRRLAFACSVPHTVSAPLPLDWWYGTEPLVTTLNLGSETLLPRMDVGDLAELYQAPRREDGPPPLEGELVLAAQIYFGFGFDVRPSPL